MMIPSWINDGSDIPDPLGCGEQAVQWLRRLKHPKNPAPGHPFQLDPVQERIIRKLYGPRHPDGSRVVRRLVLLLPRGNRKTSLCAAITLLHLIGPERQPGNLIVSAAAAHEQARELFLETALIVEHDKRLSKHLSVRDYTSSIGFKSQRSRYVAVSSDGKVQHGKTPNVVIADELHAWEGRAGQKQWEALDSALVKVPGTLMIVATTSGRGQENLAWKTVEYAIKVQKGEINDPATLPVIFMAEDGDDWQDEALWHSLNPGMKYGYPDLASYRDKAQKAINSPSDRDSFLQFNLNRWLDHSTSPFVEMAVYDQGDRPIPDDIDGRPCWIGVDMSATTDLTAVVACIPYGDDYLILPHFFCPGDNLRSRGDRDNAPYVAWAEQGFITPTPGNVIDYRAVETCIRALCDRFDVREIGFDKALAQPVMGPLVEDGLPVVEISQGWATQTPALNALEKVILEGHFIHAGHPVLRWNFANIAVHSWGNSNRAFRKDKSTGRIDGSVASWMAVSRATAGEVRSIYDSPNWSEDMAWM